VELYLQGKTYAEIETGMRHTMQAIKRYVETFGRVVYALRRKRLRPDERSYVLGISVALLREYEKLYYQALKKYPERLKEIVERYGGGAKVLEYKELDRRKEGFRIGGGGGRKGVQPMPVTDRYGAITKRTYKQSIVHLLETEYKIIGSHRVLEQLSEDLERLHGLYYGDAGKMSPGTLCWRTQALDDRTIKYAKRVEQYPAKTIYLPYVQPEDVDKRISHRKGVRNDNYQWTDRREVAQMVRLLWSAYEQGTSLTIGELSVIMNRSLTVIGKYIKQ
jgi:hypothetical protein